MDWYIYAKFMHIAFAAIWVGGGFCLVVLAVVAERARNDEAMVGVVQNVIYLGNRLFLPAGIITLLSGITMVVLGRSFGELWIILGLSGFAVSFLIGNFKLKPAADRIGAMIASDGITPAVAEESRVLIRHAKFDYVVMFLIVAVMVLKPSAEDTVVLAAMAAISLFSSFAFLAPRRRPAQAAA